MDVDTISRTLQASKTLDNVCYFKRRVVFSRNGTYVSNNYGKIQSAFVNNILKNISNNIKCLLKLYDKLL